MRLQGLILISTFSLFFIGCNDDISRNRSSNKKSPETPQTIATEVITAYSGIHRERGNAPITYNKEISLNSASNTIRPIPDISLDDDGGDGKNSSTRSSKLRPTNVCGQETTQTLNQKIEDSALAVKNGDKAIWDGKTEAGSAEGTWKLVTLADKDDASSTYEVWIDTRTGMLWSDILAEEGNWCVASGSQLQESDVVGVNCLTEGKGQSICTNYQPKALPKVKWRLPTRADYLQADLDGIRFVLKRGTNTFWTATTSTDVEKRDKAWTYNMIYGSLTAELMTSTRNIRCIGTPNF